jgi:UDP-N-acetyl-D-mannosaminuronic acid dehydrogenase
MEETTEMKICVIGLGYIGLPTALLLSKSHDVFGCDVDKERIDKINNKIPPFTESGLEEMLKESNIKAFTHPVESDVFIICVPTPFDKEVKMADLRHVKSAIEAIVPYLRRGNLIIIESTVTPGTCEKIVSSILEKSRLKVKKDIYLSHCPERAIPGKTFYEIVHNDRIVGGIDKKSADLTEKLYTCFVKGNIYKTNIRTAEFVKLMENTFRDVNIALANEFAILTEEMGINVWEAIKLANKHPRVNILTPGPGVGGHCIAVDPWFLTESTINAKIISTAREINDGMSMYVLSKAKEIFEEQNIKNPTVTIFGVAYKGNVDDTRETPALKLIKLCEREGWNVKVYDPLVKVFEYPLLPLEEAVRDTDLIIIEADHSEFKNINSKVIFTLVRNRNIIDTRNIMNWKEFLDEKFKIKVLGIGKGK